MPTICFFLHTWKYLQIDVDIPRFLRLGNMVQVHKGGQQSQAPSNRTVLLFKFYFDEKYILCCITNSQGNIHQKVQLKGLMSECTILSMNYTCYLCYGFEILTSESSIHQKLQSWYNFIEGLLCDMKFDIVKSGFQIPMEWSFWYQLSFSMLWAIAWLGLILQLCPALPCNFLLSFECILRFSDFLRFQPVSLYPWIVLHLAIKPYYCQWILSIVKFATSIGKCGSCQSTDFPEVNYLTLWWQWLRDIINTW